VTLFVSGRDMKHFVILAMVFMAAVPVLFGIFMEKANKEFLSPITSLKKLKKLVKVNTGKEDPARLDSSPGQGRIVLTDDRPGSRYRVVIERTGQGAVESLNATIHTGTRNLSGDSGNIDFLLAEHWKALAGSLPRFEVAEFGKGHGDPILLARFETGQYRGKWSKSPVAGAERDATFDVVNIRRKKTRDTHESVD